MSTKSKASSKNKKATSKKVVKKTVAKKPVAKKKVVKPAAKSKPVKKSAKPKVVAKKVTAKKPIKKAVAKKTVKKVAIKKVASKKVAAKKAAPKKAAKPAKKVVAKKVVKKVAPKKVAPVKPAKVEKPVVVKAPVVKPEKVVKAKKEPQLPVKKQIVAPTTFRTPDYIAPTKPVKEPAGKFEMEFVIRASEDMVFEFVSTESGLSEWFCDDVNIRDGIFTFDWDGQVQQAKLVKEIPPQMIRYQWLDKNDGSYFEFRIQKDELTNDISLIITDFATDKGDEASARLLWNSQVDKLLHVLGSFF
ncbi:MAG TPA: START-like domain-containing protein [Bacteroidia bacterium]|nr:START-like domain-containing protein [Bacteroidia bacterium]